jgi:hypothetical protein
VELQLAALAGLFGGMRNAAERAFLEQAKRIEADRAALKPSRLSVYAKFKAYVSSCRE